MASNVSDFNIGLMHEFTMTAARAGFDPGDFHRLTSDVQLMRNLRTVLLGLSTIEPKFVIDCDKEVDPARFALPECEVHEHRKRGQIPWNPDNIKLQIHAHVVAGLQLYLRDKPVLNACALDFLIRNQELIPHQWRNWRIFFWGTVFVDPDQRTRRVCYMYHKGGKWVFSDARVDATRSTTDVAIMLAS